MTTDALLKELGIGTPKREFFEIALYEDERDRLLALKHKMNNDGFEFKDLNVFIKFLAEESAKDWEKHYAAK